jgi:hypothetical protein
VSTRPAGQSDVHVRTNSVQEAGLDQQLEQSFASLLIGAPEPLRLLPIEAQTRHFQVLTANALQDVRDTGRVNATSSGGVSCRALRFRIVLQARGPDLSPG